jgi:hypothetical protein
MIMAKMVLCVNLLPTLAGWSWKNFKNGHEKDRFVRDYMLDNSMNFGDIP